VRNLPHSQWSTDRCRRERIPLVLVNEPDAAKHFIKAYPLKVSSLILQPSQRWRFWWQETWRRGILASFWIADTWHVTEWSRWLAGCFGQINVTEVYSSPPSITSTTSPVHSNAMFMIRPNKSSSISYHISGSKDHRLEINSQLWEFLFWINKLFDLTHPYMVIQLCGRKWKHQCGTLTASVVEIVGILTVCRPSQERNRVYARIRTQYVHPNCERWVMSATSMT